MPLEILPTINEILIRLGFFAGRSIKPLSQFFHQGIEAAAVSVGLFAPNTEHFA